MSGNESNVNECILMSLRLERDGKWLSVDEIVEYVKAYKREVESDSSSRYYDLIKYIPGNKYGLDYGCGWGAFSVMMSEKGNKIVGQDLDSNEVDIARFVWGESGNLSFTSKNVSQFSAEEFDFVTSCQVIEHTHNPGMYLHNINRVLSLGGELIISIPNIINPRFMLPLMNKNLEKNILALSKKVSSDYYKPRDHIQGWDPIHFTRLLASVGFEVVNYMPTEGVPLPRKLGRFKLPAHVFPSGRLKQFSYTMIFKAKKVRASDIGPND